MCNLNDIIRLKFFLATPGFEILRNYFFKNKILKTKKTSF